MKSRKAGCPHSAHIRPKKTEKPEKSVILRQKEVDDPAD
jgi:hypothetical protein